MTRRIRSAYPATSGTSSTPGTIGVTGTADEYADIFIRPYLAGGLAFSVGAFELAIPITFKPSMLSASPSSSESACENPTAPRTANRVLLAALILLPGTPCVSAETPADLPVWPGKTIITAASLEGLFTVSEEAGDTVTGYGGRASFGCVGAFVRQLALDASLGYRWLNGPDGPIPSPVFPRPGAGS